MKAQLRLPVDAVWHDQKTAEAEARKSGGNLWRANIKLTWGQYAGQTFKWLLENDVGWVIFLLVEFKLKVDKNELMRWQKEQLLEFVNVFSTVSTLLNKDVKVR